MEKMILDYFWILSSFIPKLTLKSALKLQKTIGYIFTLTLVIGIAFPVFSAVVAKNTLTPNVSISPIQKALEKKKDIGSLIPDNTYWNKNIIVVEEYCRAFLISTFVCCSVSFKKTLRKWKGKPKKTFRYSYSNEVLNSVHIHKYCLCLVLAIELCLCLILSIMTLLTCLLLFRPCYYDLTKQHMF